MKDIEKDFVSLKVESVIEDIKGIMEEVFDHYVNVDPELSMMSEKRQEQLITEMRSCFVKQLEKRLKDIGVLPTLSALESAGF